MNSKRLDEIKSLDEQAEKFIIALKESQIKMYVDLHPLFCSGRFRVNARYRKASFGEYLEDILTISEKTFRQNIQAIQNFPESSLEYGVGVVSKVIGVCGNRAAIVFADIDKEVAAKKNPLSRDKIETIIEKHRIIYEHERTTRRDQPKGMATK